jgi:hypothetical protein
MGRDKFNNDKAIDEKVKTKSEHHDKTILKTQTKISHDKQR